MIFAFSMQLMSIAPQYVTFGDQKMKGADGSVSSCTLKHTQLNHLPGASAKTMEAGFGC